MKKLCQNTAKMSKRFDIFTEEFAWTLIQIPSSYQPPTIIALTQIQNRL